MSPYDDFEKFKNCKCYVNNEVKSKMLPFSVNYWMFNNLIDRVLPLNDSEMYDKYILLSDLWSKMNSQIIYSRLSYEARSNNNVRRK